MTARQLKQRDLVRAPFFDLSRHQKPDVTILCESIPLFLIGRNRNGFWVVREAEGQRGGLFLFRYSAMRFTRKTTEAPGSATMFVAETLELDVPNQGSPFAALFAVAIDLIKRQLGKFTTR